MGSRFSGQKVIVPSEPGKPRYGTIVGETPTWFAVRTESGDAIMVEKRRVYSYDPAALEELKHMYGKFLEAKISLREAEMSLQAAWSNLVPLVAGEKLPRAKKKLSDIDLLEITCDVVAGQLKQKEPQFIFEETDVQLILMGHGNSRGSASGPVTIVRSIEELSKVKEGDVLVAESVMLDRPWFQAAMRACALVVDSGKGWAAYRPCIRGPVEESFTLSWEVGIPCIGGAMEVARVLESGHLINGDKKATEILIDGQIVTVDSMRGEVYAWQHASGVGTLESDFTKSTS